MRGEINREKTAQESEAVQIPELQAGWENSLAFITGQLPAYAEVGDEEAIFNLALLLGHPEWKEQIFSLIKREKPHVKNAGEIFERIQNSYAGWQKAGTHEPPLSKISWWAEHLPQLREKIAETISFFGPDPKTIPSQIEIMPGDTILAQNHGGMSFYVSSTGIIVARTGNFENSRHEFLHAIINPLTEKLRGKISEEKILELAGIKLKSLYGNSGYSILNEELIRTYNDFFADHKKLPTFEDMERATASMDETQFSKILSQEPDTKKRLTDMNVKTLREFKTRLKEYFNLYEKDLLRERIYNLYQGFGREKNANPRISFEDFLNKNVEKLFAE